MNTPADIKEQIRDLEHKLTSLYEKREEVDDQIKPLSRKLNYLRGQLDMYYKQRQSQPPEISSGKEAKEASPLDPFPEKPKMGTSSKPTKLQGMKFLGKS